MVKRSSARRSGKASTARVVGLCICAFLALAGIRAFVFEPFSIPSGSMSPTLLVGDYLFVSLYSYGYSRYSLPLLAPRFSGRIFGSLPARGDVAVFKLPRDTSTDYIKRIIGLPGDRVQMKSGQLYINGIAVPRRAEGEFVTEVDEGPRMMLKRYVETLPASSGAAPKRHDILKADDNQPLDNTQEYLVPPGMVFAMGDNRDNSLDSRVLNAVGYIPEENLVGRAEFRFFSIDETSPWWEVWEWPFEIRWSRLFTRIH